MHRRESAREDAGVTRRILTLWVIYDNPLDYPGKLVARRQYATRYGAANDAASRPPRHRVPVREGHV
jgi:hypothetical protein